VVPEQRRNNGTKYKIRNVRVRKRFKRKQAPLRHSQLEEVKREN
jgi:hypothetical protein